MPINDHDIRPVPFDFGLPVGAQYYRAPTPPPEDWEHDLDQLQQNGMNTIKIWAQWRWNHPRPDAFWFDDLDRLMDLAAERGLRVVINTIFDVLPAWLGQLHPDCLMVRQDGRPLGPTTLAWRQIGGAPGPCLNHTPARQYRRQFLEATVRQYCGHSALWLWDLWNEPELTCGMVRGGEPEQQVCWCPACRRAFLLWLQQRYCTLDDLNRTWSRNYNSWNELELPGQPDVYADWIDWRLFQRDTITAEMRWRAELTRGIDPCHPVMCHSVPPPVFNIACCGSDDFQLAREGDLFGNSSSGSPLSTDFGRSAAGNRPLLCSEIHAIPGMTLLRPRPIGRQEMEHHFLVPLFRGVKGFLFWQYRAELLGKEAPAWGMTRPDGSPEPWLGHFRDTVAWLQEHADFLLNARPEKAPVGIVLCPENEIFFYCHDHSLERYWNSILGAYRLLSDAGYSVDFVRTDVLSLDQLQQYHSLVVPCPYALDRQTVTQLIAWVERGGKLLLEGFACAHNPADGMAATVNPGMGLNALCGCREIAVVPQQIINPTMAYGVGSATQGQSPACFTTHTPIGCLAAGTQLIGSFGRQSLAPAEGQALADFADGSAAIVRRCWPGGGHATLIGCWLFENYQTGTNESACELVAGLLDLPGPEVSCACRQVRISTLIGSRQRCWVLAENTSDQPLRAVIRLSCPVSSATALPQDEALTFQDDAIMTNLSPGEHQVIDIQSA